MDLQRAETRQPLGAGFLCGVASTVAGLLGANLALGSKGERSGFRGTSFFLHSWRFVCSTEADGARGLLCAPCPAALLRRQPTRHPVMQTPLR